MKKLGMGLAIVALAILPATTATAQGKGNGNGGGGGGGGGGRDKTPPVVSITNPGDGATVSGSVSVTADATDNVGVTSVEYSVDGGAAVAMSNTSGSTWSASWDSASVLDGAHTITVTARDAKGNAAVDSVNVNANNGTGPQWPDSMAALGDSITRGVFADDSLSGLDFGQPEHSWATGWDGGDVVNSHYERILGNNGAILNNNFNNSVSGARMDDLLSQANNTVPQAPDYILVFMGHNDLCRDDVSQIPSDAEFESHFRAGLDTLINGVPDANIVVLEIIDVVGLWDCCSGNFGCQIAWSLYGFCYTVTASNSTDRAITRNRTIGFNDILRSVSAEKGVTFEDDIFEVSFTTSDLSDVDCFHPSSNGQAKIAAGSYDESRF